MSAKNPKSSDAGYFKEYNSACPNCKCPVVTEIARGWWCTNAECNLRKKKKDIRRGDKYRPAYLTSKELTVKPTTPKTRRYFIGRPGTLVGASDSLQHWHEWEVGESATRDRICLTSCERKAALIRDALEAFHQPKK